MKIQTRLSLFSSIVFGVVFIVISLLIYGLYSNSKEKSIFDNLEKTSYIIAFFYLEEDELDKNDFAKIKDQFEESVSNVNYQVYDEKDSMNYGTTNLEVSSQRLNEIRQKEKLAFSDNGYYNYGIYYEDNQGNFVIISRENKSVLSEQQQMLIWILAIAFLIGIIIIIFLSRWMAHLAYKPFRKAIEEVNNISINNNNLQIQSPNTEDELEDLIDTFNKLLAKIDETFIIQKNFVNYVSHEFRTPLTSMLGHLEVSLIKERSPEEYKILSLNIIQQIKHLEDIINTLLIVSDLGKNTEETTSTRIDDLIWRIIEKVTEQYTDAKIMININVAPDNEALLTISKNRAQLFMALFNIIENAVKYSKGSNVNINLFIEQNFLNISIKDKGIGIPANQLDRISKPFYRANNTKTTQGSGIGLSIALRILEKNNIRYQIQSSENVGTEIIITFQ